MTPILDTKITRIEAITENIIILHTDKNINVKLFATDIGTYKNDNVKWLIKNLKVGQVIDIIYGEQGWAINTYPKRKAYYQEQTKFLNEESEVI